MDNELQVFKFEEMNVQITGLLIDGEPYFVGKEITEVLGYKNASKALNDHVDQEDKLNNKTLSSFGQRGAWIINESGLYSLILKSKVEGAKKFKRWVTSEVLPSIRKNGAYMTPVTVENAIADPDFMIALLQNLKEEQTKRKELELTIEIQAPKVESFNFFINAEGYQRMNDVAKALGYGRNKLYEFLRSKEVLMKNNTPYQRFINQGYFVVKENPINKGGFIENHIQTYVTSKGVDYIHKLINKDK